MLKVFQSSFIVTTFVLCVVIPVLCFAGSESVFQEPYRLGSGDEVKMTVFGEPELSATYKVSGTGSIAVPLIGDVFLEGLSLAEAEQLIFSKLSDGYLVDPSISLEVSEHRPFYIMGEVRNPGRYAYVDDMTALQAVALAGGYTYRARQSRVKVRNTNGQEQVGQPDIKVSPGDVVVIEERFF